MSKIPLQGCQGSYAVMDLELVNDAADGKILSIFAIRVINGEERGIFSEEAIDHDYEKLIRNLWEEIGYLPVVLCDRSGRQREALENGWGIYTGRPFSNQVIEICEMAGNHLPGIQCSSLDQITEYLRIEAQGEGTQEQRCRKIWKAYCRLDHYDLER